MTLNVSAKKAKFFVMMSIDSFIVVTSFLVALKLARGEIVDIEYNWYEYLWMFAVVLAAKLLIFVRTGLYNEIVRFVSMDFAAKVVKSTILGSVIAVSIIHIVRPEIQMHVLVVDWMASCILIGLSRFGFRYIVEGRLSRSQGRNAILYGAGEHGASIARHLLMKDNLGYRVIGFIDDNVEKHGKSIHGIPVLGRPSDLPRIVEDEEIEELIVTFSEPDGELVKNIFNICKSFNIRCRIVPGMSDMISGKEYVRSVDIADLMRRPKRSLNKSMISQFIRGRRVLITGAAGSIGSELFRQVLANEPGALAGIDHSEFLLYKLDEEFSSHRLKERTFLSLVDVKRRDQVDELMKSFKPEIVFHAAAYKHVPILEQDIRQAVQNNVGGLINVVESAKSNGVKKFVFISTDKAIRPTNVMGATKRIGEFITHFANGDGMSCVGVRFGNVLASSGSVVPKFIEQIRAGGPVTVTHPDVTRFFMLIPEAVELVLQAASIGMGGEIFVLDMGRPIKILEMAEDLIALMGFVPHRDISVQFTGLRPGEKLHEELFLDEIERPTQFKDINIGRMKLVDKQLFFNKLRGLLEEASSGDGLLIKDLIKGLVPEYTTGDAGASKLIDAEDDFSKTDECEYLIH
jgi:FlaA1/EpsC-like NDP-sugar epimerase